MRQFDVYRDRRGTLFCILQNDFLLDRASIMVAPLARSNDPVAEKLGVAVELEGWRHVLDVNRQVPADARTIRRGTPVATLDEHRDAIMDAINFLYWGI